MATAVDLECVRFSGAFLSTEQKHSAAKADALQIENGAVEQRMSTDRSSLRWPKLAVIITAIALAAQTVYLLVTLLARSAGPPPAADRPLVPAYDVSSWYALPVQSSRTEPFQTACTELVREI